MLLRYRFDLTAATKDECSSILERINGWAWTGAIYVAPNVYDAFFQETENVATIVNLPEGCTVTRLS